MQAEAHYNKIKAPFILYHQLYLHIFIKNDLYYSRFKKKSYFSLRSGGTDYVITSRSGFLKLFPTYKKQLKAYCRKERLDFKEDGGVRAMTRLTEYIDSLIHGK
jgi:hypothetical protein